TMTQATGAAFSLYSIDFDNSISQNTDNSNQTLKLTFHYVGGGTSTKLLTLDRLAGLQTFVLSEYNLLSVDWVDASGNGSYGAWQFDNAKVNVDCPTQ
ncbi:MAG TPA: hypothetical protein VFM48_08060, partial [Aquabacterium sp.]|nr:hypothetical protein [Aquabacterium sp.]